jgi:hypothetical protein
MFRLALASLMVGILLLFGESVHEERTRVCEERPWMVGRTRLSACSATQQGAFLAGLVLTIGGGVILLFRKSDQYGRQTTRR